MALSRNRLIFPWRCPQCSFRTTPMRTLPIRSFATTPSLKSTEPPMSTTAENIPVQPPGVQIAPSAGVKPESPRYLRIPETRQPVAPKDPWIKGFLPKPRDIFSAKRGHYERADKARLHPATLSPRKQRRAAPPERQALIDYRIRMAAMRRSNLRQGLYKLRQRMQHRDAIGREKHSVRATERREMMTAQPSDPEKYTTVTQTAEITAPLENTEPYMINPDATERHAAKIARYQAQATKKASETQEALHTLFMRARDFIVTEEQLDKEIENAFGTQETPKNFRGGARGTLIGSSIWAHGDPPSLESMLQATGQASGGSLSERDMQARARLQQQRLKKVAEKLTGGKM